ncbi:MAG: M28 family peptidase [Bacteroidetes bacterium]|jgi:hypothetical protein|nr:M28 family peptidase [Bacteroidota bacterium]
MKSFFLLLALMSAAVSQPIRPTPFVPDSALALLRVLSVDIGPRPMGSPAEQRALAWAAERLRVAGVDDVRVMDVRTTPAGAMNRVRNTSSGVTVGTLHGAGDRIIVIGAHIDSASPEIPGANDDGSGTAVVLELARVLALREWQHTIVFCLFGGEEAGLVGSRVFVEQYEHLDRVDLMLQVDMANGVDDLVPFIDKGTTQTPSWLFLGAQEELLSMGYDGLSYPFHFFTWNIASGSGASSDHEPFLLRGIPAIDFTTDPNDPIHTPQDSWEWFRPGGLDRSGDLIYRLVDRFDRGMPEERTGSYVAVPVASTFLLLPTWSVWAGIVVSFVAAILSLLRRWPHRTERRGSPRPRVPGLKVFGGLLMIWLAIWSSENVVAWLSGWRSPWYAQPWLMVAPAAAVAFLALVLVSRWSRRWNLSSDPVRFLLRSIIWFAVLALSAALASPRLAAYLAWGLIFSAAAWALRPAWLRIACIVVGAYPVVRLLTPDLFPFVARAFSQIPAHGFFAEAALTAGLAFVCSIVALPYAFGALAVVRDPAVQWPTSFSYRRPVVAWASIGTAVLTIGAVSLSEPYSAARPRSVTVTTTIEEGRDSASTIVASNDWLRDLRVTPAGAETVSPGSVAQHELPKTPARAETWLSIDEGPWTAADTGAGVSGLVRLTYDRQPIRLSIVAMPVRSRVLEASGGSAVVNRTDRSAEITFEPPAPSTQLLPFWMHLSAPDSVTLTVEATFVGSAGAIAVEGAPVNVVHRTVVRSTRRLTVPPTLSQP